jgi:hypothetical protein
VAGTVKLEKLGKPGIFIPCDTFADAAKSAAEDNAMPAVRLRTISAAEFYRVRGNIKEVTPLAERLLDSLVDALIRPLTAEEMKPQPVKKEAAETTGVTVTGDTYPAALEEFNQVFLDKLWGDGLPLVPPTSDRVKWMLTGTSLAPEEVIGKVPPKEGMATVEKIAINAVMAGARPEYLPVIIAAMAAITDADYDARHILLSAGSFGLMIVVSGPIAKEINMRSGIGFLGHGWRANNTIGRAVRLATLNIGHIWPALNDMALTGRGSPHTFLTFAENADLNPWEPYHVTQGYNPEDSCVTVATIGGGREHYGGSIGTWTAQGVLDRIVQNVLTVGRFGLSQWGSRGVGAIPGSGGGVTRHLIVLFPAVAAELHKLGYKDRQSLQEEIYRRAVVRYEELTPADIKSIQTAMSMGYEYVIPPERRAVFQDALKLGRMVPVQISPKDIPIFVAGSAPGDALGFNYLKLPPYKPTGILTKLVTRATLTKAGTVNIRQIPYGG